ncbi:MAG TPA: FAD-binding oxidoreductase [Solirubrobacteraceae bacterium]|nr:FAD-binding oxidoreductase [Solirubrobacteraceae bacterium]
MHVQVIGAGVVGCSAAAFLAEAGARVTVHDREGIAAGASGRNSGILQHPYDPALAPLYTETIALHREVLDLPAEPAGILLLGAPRDLPLPPELRPEWLEDARDAEPQLAPGLSAMRIETGWPVGPRTATEAWADRARAAGAVFGAHADGADVTLLATGAWTTAVPVRPLWGVTATVALDDPPRHVLEEASVQEISAGVTSDLFSLVTAQGVSVLGSTVSEDAPDVAPTVELIRQRAERFLPRAARARVTASRSCPRPQTIDGRPIVGRLDRRTFVCTGHGPWGISTGPATARHVAAQILDGTPPPPELHPGRFAP